MAQSKDTTDFSGLLFQFMGMEDPMLNMLEWLCEQMMEVEVSKKIGADKHEQSHLAIRRHDMGNGVQSCELNLTVPATVLYSLPFIKSRMMLCNSQLQKLPSWGAPSTQTA